MARTEQITVKLVKSQDYEGLRKKLVMEAEELKKQFGSIKIGDAKAYSALAKAEKDLATAALNRAKAEKVSAEAAAQREKADKAAIQTATARLKQDQEQAKVDLANAKTKTQLAKTETELANAEKARYQAIKELENATKAKLQAEKEAQNVATAQIITQKEAANAEKARVQIIKESANAEKAKSQAAKEAQNAITAELRTEKESANALKAKNQATKEMYNAQKASLQVQKEATNVVKANLQAQKAELSLNKQLSASHSSLASSLKNVVLQYISLQTVTRSLRSALTEMKSMSDQMIVYQKVTKASAEEMEKIRAASYDTAKRYGQTPTDFLSAAQEMARAGYKDQSAAMADLAIKTKLVGDITAEEASKFLLAVDAGYKYGGSIEKLSLVLDQANEIGNNYATSVSKLSEGMTLVASLANQANVPIEQLMAALGTMTSATQRSGQEMARALRFIILGVLGDTTTEVEEGVTVTKEEVDSLSTALQYYAKDVVDAAKASGKLINPMEALGALAKAYKEGLIGSEEELFKISKNLAGQRYYNAFAALIANWDTMYEGMLEKEQQALGSADAEIAVLTNSWTTKLNVLKTTWTEVVNKSISEGFIKDLITVSTEALKFAGNLENIGIMALGAYEAVKSLSAGIKNLRMGQGFGRFNFTTLLLGAGIGAIGYIKSSYEKSIRDLQEAAAKAAQEAAEKATKEATTLSTLSSIQAKYEEIAKDGIQSEQGETEKLKTLQNELNGLIGDQAIAVDLVNGKYEESIKKLKNIKAEQEAVAREELQVAISAAVANYQTHFSTYPTTFENIYGSIFGDENIGVSRRYSPGVNFNSVDAQSRSAVQKYILSNPSFGLDFGSTYGWEASIWADGDEYRIVDDYKKYYDLYKWMATHDSSGAETSKTYETIAAKNKDFYAKFGSFVSELSEYAKPIITLREQMENLGKSTEKASNQAEGGTSTLSKSVDELTESIGKATTAKEKFDAAMKTTKADAMNGYISAFKTLQKEIDEGRVNSTAYYASARMLLGDKAYFETGGTSQGVMKALKNKGASGSVMEAYDILSATYKDQKTDKVIEGAGIYQLLSQTKGFEGKLVDKNGNMYIPNLSDSDLNKISKQWGGLSKEFILSALNAFDQYDKKGSATDENVQAQLEEDDVRTKEIQALELGTEAHNNNTTAIDTATTALDTVTVAIVGLTEAIDKKETPDETDLEKDSLSDVPQEIIDKVIEDSRENAQDMYENMSDSERGEYGNPQSAQELWTAMYGAGGGGLPIREYGTGDNEEDVSMYALDVASGKAQQGTSGLKDHWQAEEETVKTAKEAVHAVDQATKEATQSVSDLSGHWQADEESVKAIQEAVDQVNKSIQESQQSLQALADNEEDVSMYALDVASGKAQQGTSGLKDHWQAEEETVKTAKEAVHAVDQATKEATQSVSDLSGHWQADEESVKAIQEAVDQVNKSIQESQQSLQALADDEEDVSMYALETANNTQENAEEHKKLFSEYENSLQQMLALKQELEATDGDMYEAQKNLGTSWEEVKEAFLDYQKYVIDNPVKPDLNDSQIRDAFKEFMDNWSNTSITWGLNANPNSAIATANATRNAINGMSASIKITGKYVGTTAPMLAGGTRSHAGGPAVVNDGSGPELVVDNGNAFIANGGKPAIVTLNKGAKVFTASETRGILGGSGIPAYANGVGDITAGKFNGLVRVTDDDGNNKSSSSGKSGGSKSGSIKKAATFDNLKDIINYIINRIGTALDQQIEIIDKQIDELKAQRESKQQQDELLEKQKNLTTAMNERTVRYIDSKGKWHWEADRNKVAEAQEELQKYKEELEFNAKVQALENQKTALQDEYKQITTAWSEIQDAAATPTGNLTNLLNQVISTGSKTDKKAAETVKSLLISSLLNGGSYKKNYKEALTAISKATAGNPIMPGESKNTLASLIAMGGGASGDITSSLMKTSGALSSSGNVSLGTAGAGSQVNYNYFIDGMKIGSDQANQSLSSIMRQLSVYANTGVA